MSDDADPGRADDRFMLGCGLLVGVIGVLLWVWPAVWGWVR